MILSCYGSPPPSLSQGTQPPHKSPMMSHLRKLQSMVFTNVWSHSTSMELYRRRITPALIQPSLVKMAAVLPCRKVEQMRVQRYSVTCQSPRRDQNRRLCYGTGCLQLLLFLLMLVLVFCFSVFFSSPIQNPSVTIQTAT